MTNHNCPCGKRKSGLFIECFQDDCDVGWWHVTCVGFNKDVTKKQLDSLGHWSCPSCVMKKLQVPGYSFSCNSCHGLVSQVKSQVETLESHIADLKELKQSFADHNKTQVEASKSWSEVVASFPTSNDSSFASSLAKQVVDHSARMSAEKETRDKNIIIFNADESGSDVGSSRKSHDQKLFDDICEVVVKQSVPVKSINRLGKLPSKDDSNDSDAPPSKPRPLKISFSSVFDKRKFLANMRELKNARDDIKKISIQHDLSPEERKTRKDLVLEAREKNENLLPEADFLYKVRGPPHAVKIVKVSKR